MMEQLRLDPIKIPHPSRDHIMQMQLESLNSLEIDVTSRFKTLWVINTLDGSEDYLASERAFALVGKSFKQRNLMLIPNLRILMDRQGLITPPKGVKRKQGYKTSETEPVDEGDELFDCEGDKLVINEHNEEHQSDKENDRNVEKGAIKNQDENDQVNVYTVSSSNILLGDLCRGDNDLRKDAVFIDKLGKLLGNAETPTQFIPYITEFNPIWTELGNSLLKNYLISFSQQLTVK